MGNNLDRLVTELRDWEVSKEDVKEYRKALLGRGLPDEETTRVDGRNGYVWVRNRQDPNQIYQVLGGVQPDIPGWPVIVGPHEVNVEALRIIDTDWSLVAGFGGVYTGIAGTIGAHHWQHESGAWDMVNVDRPMIIPFRTVPATSGGNWDVIVEHDDCAYLGPIFIDFPSLDDYETGPIAGVRVTLATGIPVSNVHYMLCLNEDATAIVCLTGTSAAPLPAFIGGFPLYNIAGYFAGIVNVATKPTVVEALARNLYPISTVYLQTGISSISVGAIESLTPLHTWPGKYWATGIVIDQNEMFTGSTVQAALEELWNKSGGTGSSGVEDHKLKVSVGDTTADFLQNKLIADDPLNVYVQNNDANEVFHIAIDTDEIYKVKVSDDDATPNYLEQKIATDGVFIETYITTFSGTETFHIEWIGPGTSLSPDTNTQQRMRVKTQFSGNGTTKKFRLGNHAVPGTTLVRRNRDWDNLYDDYFESDVQSTIDYNTAPTGGTTIYVDYAQAFGGEDVNVFQNPICQSGLAGWTLESGTYGSQGHLTSGSVNSTVTSGAAIIPIMNQTIELQAGNYLLVRSLFDRWGSGGQIKIYNSDQSVERWSINTPVKASNAWERQEFPLVIPYPGSYNFRFYEKNNSDKYSDLILAKVSDLHPNQRMFETYSILRNGCFFDVSMSDWTLSAGFSRVSELDKTILYVGGSLKSTDVNPNTATQSVTLEANTAYTITFFHWNVSAGSCDVRIRDGGSVVWTTGELKGLAQNVVHSLHYTYLNSVADTYTFELRSNDNNSVYFNGIRIYKVSV